MSLTDALRTMWDAEQRVQADKQRFDPLVCQCCGADTSKGECVCDGLNWHLDKDGRVECEAHRFARAVGGSKKSFGFWRLKR